MSGKFSLRTGTARRPDPRTNRTRAALLNALAHLVLHRRKRHISVPDVIAEAGIARSTFYDHYESADALLLAAMRKPLASLADAAVGLGRVDVLVPALAHYWENRQRARDILSGRLRNRTEQMFTELVDERLGTCTASMPRRLAARQLADATLGPVRAWLLGEAACTPEVLALMLVRTGEALRSELVGAE